MSKFALANFGVKGKHTALAAIVSAIGIKAFSVLAHHHKVKRAEPVAQAGIGSRRPHIREQIEILTKVFWTD